MPQNDTRAKTVNTWILAARPRTLPAAVAPVVVGSALAYRDGAFALLPAAAAMMVALLLQIGVNLANDYFDYIKGVDTERRLGPVRVTQSGLLSPQQVKAGMSAFMALSAVPGLYLLSRGGWPVLAAGASALVSALAYSGGPFPLASNGLGDLFVFIFFGLVAVCGTYYVQAGTVTPTAAALAVIVGLLITAILVVNNLRDIETDRGAGKRTLAVTLGKTATRLEYTILLAGAYIGLLAVWSADAVAVWALLPLLSLPLCVSLVKRIWLEAAGSELNSLLAATAKLALVFSLLLSGGISLAPHFPP